MSSPHPIQDRLRSKLLTALAPTRLDIRDNLERHRGHGGHHPEGESHLSLTVVSAAFRGQSRVDRQRQVYELLAEELAGRIHALSLRTLTPEEDCNH